MLRSLTNLRLTAVEQRPSIGKLDPTLAQSDPKTRESLMSSRSEPTLASQQPSPFSAAAMRAPAVLTSVPTPTGNEEHKMLGEEEPSSRSRQRMSIIPEREQFKIDEAKEDEADDSGVVDEP